MKIKLSKSQWELVGKKAGWMKKAQIQQLQPLDGVQKSPAAKVDLCPKCKHNEHAILNSSNPIINECKKCKHKWNPDNVKSEASKKISIVKKAEFAENMMPGQTPYTPEEKLKVKQLVNDAAKGDPGESMESMESMRDNDPYKAMRTVRVHFNDGEKLVTSINGTKKEILKYYMPYGNRGPDQDFDNAHPERVHHVIKVDFLD